MTALPEGGVRSGPDGGATDPRAEPADRPDAEETRRTNRPALGSWWRRGPTWWNLATAVVLMTGGVLVTLDAWTDIVRIARRDEEQSHILLVPVVALYLFWVRRARLRGYVPSASWAGPVAVVLGWAAYRAGDVMLVQSMWHLGAILVVAGGFLSVAGGGFLTRFLPVFASLLFLVPVPGRIREAVAMPLQSATAVVTQAVLDTLGVPVERWGNTLRINGEDVTIAEACAGLRMVFALVLVTFVFAYGVPMRNGVRLVVLAASPLVAIAFNVVRLVPTVWVFGNMSPETALLVHDFGGWFMPPCAFISLLGLMRLLRWAQVPVAPYSHAFGS